jgi:hypothetical protein
MDNEPMTLGDLRSVLALAAPDLPVSYDQFGLCWEGLDSWRGIYAYPALGWRPYDAAKRDDATAGRLLALIDRALAGEVFTGYKGGEYTFSHASPVWVDNYGKANSTALIGAAVEPWGVVLKTAHVAEVM